MESVIVAIGILIVIASVGVVAILKYQTVEEALKIWGALSGLFGVVIGAFVTFFFTQPQLVDAENRLAAARAEITKTALSAQVAISKFDSYWKDANDFKWVVSHIPDDTTWGEIKSNPEAADFVSNEWRQPASFSVGISKAAICDEINGEIVCRSVLNEE